MGGKRASEADIARKAVKKRKDKIRAQVIKQKHE